MRRKKKKKVEEEEGEGGRRKRRTGLLRPNVMCNNCINTTKMKTMHTKSSFINDDFPLLPNIEISLAHKNVSIFKRLYSINHFKWHLCGLDNQKLTCVFARFEEDSGFGDALSCVRIFLWQQIWCRNKHNVSISLCLLQSTILHDYIHFGQKIQQCLGYSDYSELAVNPEGFSKATV